MTDEHFLLVLQAQTEELTDRAGWDKRAVFAYLEAVDNKFGQFAKGYEGEQITTRGVSGAVGQSVQIGTFGRLRCLYLYV